MLTQDAAKSATTNSASFNVTFAAKCKAAVPLRPTLFSSSPTHVACILQQPRRNLPRNAIIGLLTLTELDHDHQIWSHISIAIHKTPLHAILLGRMRNDRQLLITASSDALCLSKLRGQADPGPHVSSAAFLLEEDYVLLEKPPGKVSSLSFDAHEKRIAACIDEDVYVVSTLGADVGKVTRLEGHLSKVTAAEFCTHQGTHVIGDSRNWLISISEDRSFKVWDVHEKACLYQSGIESPVPLTCVAVETQRLRMCIGSEDGRLRFYELTPTPTKARKGLPCEPRCLKIFESSPLFKLTLTKSNSQSSLVEVVSSIPSWRNPKSSKHPSQKDNEGGDIVDENHDVQPSNSVISLRYFEQQDPSVDFAGSGACLIVGLMHGIFVLDANVYMPIFHYDFRDTSIPLDVSCRQSLYEETEVETTTEMNDTLADGYAFAASHTGGSMTIMIGNTMSGCISLLNLYQSCIGSKSDFIGYDLDWDSFETLGEVVETIIQGHVQGPWLKNIYQDCMTKLASIGIMSLEMLLESDVDLPSNMPKYVVSALQRYKTNAVTNAATSALEMLSFSVPTEVQIYPDSPLQHAAKLRNSTNKEGTSSKSTAKSATKAKRDNLNKPVTFRTKVKSSGYIEGPKVTKLFTRSSSNTSTSSSTSRQTHRKISTSSVGYPMECSVISEHIKSNEPIVHSAPVTCVKFHPSGQYLATASVDKTARSYRFPVRSKSTSTKHFIGHNGMIHSAAWSHDRVVGQGPLLLTGAVDGTARLWTIEKSDPLLVFSNIHGSQCRKHSTNSINGSSGSSSASSSLFGSEIKQVAFYHRDQFIFIMNRNKLLLYSYNLEKPDPGSVKPQLNYNRYKLIRSFESETSHSVTSFASVNSFTSHLALCGTSDRALNVWDMNAGKCVRSVPSAHSRPIHTLAIADYESVPPGFENVFASAAITDSIKCWDVRVPRAVMHLHGHINRQYSISCALSPCGRYIATGSEDNHVYLYDVRKGLVAARLRGTHSDIVSSVDFHPVVPQLVSGSYCGKVCLFNAK